MIGRLFQYLSDMGEVKQPRQEHANAQRDWPFIVAENNAPNEELTCANEKLRAVNQELVSQNLELKQLNEELTAALHSTAIPVVMVDRNFRIRLVSPAAEYPFNCRPSDLGHPITDIRPNFHGANLGRLLNHVIASSPTAKTGLVDVDGRHQELRVQPYRVGHRVEGAILTLIDIDGARGDELERLLIESIPGPVIVLDRQLRVKLVSRDFLTAFALLPSNVMNRPLDEVLNEPFDAPEFRDALARLSNGQSDAEEIGLLNKTQGAGAHAVVAITRRIHRLGNPEFVMVIRDIGEHAQSHLSWAQALVDAEDALQASHQELRALAGRLMYVQDEERRRLSRELHDDLSQNVAALQLDMEALPRKLPAELRGEQEQLRAIQDYAQNLADNLRRIAHGLHPSTIEVLGLPGALRVYAGEFSERTGIVVDFKAATVPSRVPPEVAGSFFRIFQEALRNIAKHATGSSVDICLSADCSQLILSVRDSGPGFDREKVRGKGGLGLVSMEERARLIRARFQLETAPGKGVSLTVSAPLV